MKKPTVNEKIQQKIDEMNHWLDTKTFMMRDMKEIINNNDRDLDKILSVMYRLKNDNKKANEYKNFQNLHAVVDWDNYLITITDSSKLAADLSFVIKTEDYDYIQEWMQLQSTGDDMSGFDFINQQRMNLIPGPRNGEFYEQLSMGPEGDIFRAYLDASKASIFDNIDGYMNIIKSIMEEAIQDMDNEEVNKPDRYMGKEGDLLSGFEDYILTEEEMIGAYKFNIIKYIRRFNQKNGVSDLKKARIYLDRLTSYWENVEEDGRE